MNIMLVRDMCKTKGGIGKTISAKTTLKYYEILASLTSVFIREKKKEKYTLFAKNIKVVK